MYDDGDEEEYEVPNNVSESSQNSNIQRTLSKMNFNENDGGDNEKRSKIKKELGKGIIDLFKGLFKLFMMLPLFIKVIIIVLILAIFLFLAVQIVNKKSEKDVTQKANATVSEMKVKLDDPDLPAEEKEKIKKAVDAYEQNNSFIYFTLDDIIATSNSYMEEYEDSTNDASAPTYQSLSKEHGSIDATDKIVNINQKRPLFQHMIMTEKYNFNSVEWLWFGHAHPDEGETMNRFARDEELGLKYPDDSDVQSTPSKIDTFVKLLTPYLQTWHIPLAINSGLITKGANGEAASMFTYSTLKYTYSDIIAHRYDVQKYILNTNFKDYIQTEYRSQIKMGIRVSEIYKAQTDGTVNVGEGQIGTDTILDGPLTINTSNINDTLKNGAADRCLNLFVNSKGSSSGNYHVVAKFASSGPMMVSSTINYNNSCSNLPKIVGDLVYVTFYKIERGGDNYTIYKMKKSMSWTRSDGWKVTNEGGRTSETTWSVASTGNLAIYYNIQGLVLDEIDRVVREKNSTEPNKYYRAIYNGDGSLNKNATFASVPASGNYYAVTYRNLGDGKYNIISKMYEVTKNEYLRDAAGNYIYDIYYKYEYTDDSKVEQKTIYDYGDLGGDYDNTRVPGTIRSSRVPAGTTIVTKDPVACSAPVNQNTLIDPMLEEEESRRVEITPRYNVKLAKTLDIKVEIALEYNKYSESDASNRINAKTYKETVEDYHNEIDIANRITGSALSSYKRKTLYELEFTSDLSIVGTESGFTGISQPTKYNFLREKRPGEEVLYSVGQSRNRAPNTDGTFSNSQSYTNLYRKNGTYIIQDGKSSNNQGLHHVERMWEDDFRVSSFKKDTYTIDDLIEYNAKINSADKSKIDESKKEYEKLLKENPDSYKNYKVLESNTQLNNIDFMNSNKSIFNEYLSVADTIHQSEVEGYARGWLQLAFDEMRDLLEDPDNKGKSKYIYGISLGLEEGKFSSGTPSNRLGGMSGGFAWPVDNEYISAIQGYSPIYGSEHGGVDIWATYDGDNHDYSAGKYPVYAAASGEVIVASDVGAVSSSNLSSSENGGAGNYIAIKHDNGYITSYMHLFTGTFSVKVGDKVTKGQEIAKIGSSGNSSCLHLHFNIYKNDDGDNTYSKEDKLDPLSFYKIEAVNGNTIEYDELMQDDSLRYNLPNQFNLYKYAGPLSNWDGTYSNGTILSDVSYNLLVGMEGAGRIVEDGGQRYYAIEGDGAGNLTVGPGVDIYNGGFTNLFIEAGYVDAYGNVLVDKIPEDFVTNIKNMEIEEKQNGVKNYLDANSITLTDYQLEALTLRAYHCGLGGWKDGHYPQQHGLTFAEAYNRYWKGQTEFNDINSDDFYKYFMFSPTDIGGNGDHDAYTRGFIKRRRIEYYLFVTGGNLSDEEAFALDLSLPEKDWGKPY